MRTANLLLFAITLTCGVAHAAEQPKSDKLHSDKSHIDKSPPDAPSAQAGARKAVGRSLVFIEQKGVEWMKERGCVTCHQTTFLIWTHNEARRRGFDVDERKLHEWTSWALVNVLAGADGSTPPSAEALSQALLGRGDRDAWSAKPPHWPHRTVDPYENVLKHLMRDQAEDGRWEAGGQSDNPPEIPTGWAVLALGARERYLAHDGPGPNPRRLLGPMLQRLVKENDEGLPKARERGLAWLRKAEPGQPDDLNERLVLRLLVQHEFAEAGEKGQAKQRLRELLARQNADGGWSAAPGLRRESDAFATGQSLYALRRVGVAADAPVAVRAAGYLADTQRADGSWFVPTTAFHPASGKPKRDDETDAVYTYWGTAWATLGLLHTLPTAAEAPANPR